MSNSERELNCREETVPRKIAVFHFHFLRITSEPVVHREEAVPGRGSCQGGTLPLLLNYHASVQLCTRGTKISYKIQVKMIIQPGRRPSAQPGLLPRPNHPSEAFQSYPFQQGAVATHIYDVATCQTQNSPLRSRSIQ